MMPADLSQKPVVDAMQALTAQLSKLNTYFDQQQQRESRQEVMGHPDRTSSLGIGAPTSGLYDGRNLTLAQIRKTLKDEIAYQRTPGPMGRGQSRVGAVREALGAFSPQREQPVQQTRGGSVSPSASTPQAVGGQPMGQFSGRPRGVMDTSHEAILDLGIMGQYTGKTGKAISTMALESIGLQKAFKAAANQTGPDSSLGGWAANGVPKGVPFLGGKNIPGLNPQNLKAVSGALDIASNNPMATFAAYKSVQGLRSAMSGAAGNLKDFQTLGQTLGGGTPAVGGQNIFGFHNPLGYFGTAAQTGGSLALEQQALMGRIPGYGFGAGSMNSQQAQQAVSSLAGQGFSNQPANPILSTIAALPGVGGALSGLLSGVIGGGPKGDLTNIAQNLDRPLANLYGNGFNVAQTNEQFAPALRNAGTSIQQLTDTLSNLNQESKSTKETVDQMRDSIFNAGQSFQSMGASAGGSYGLAKGFTDITGMDPQIAAQIAQNPMFQGLALGQYGVLPSGIGDMNPGAFSQNTTQTIGMYAQALKGLDVNRYRTVNGVRQLVSNGQTAMEDQIHAMTGLPTSVVNRILGDQSGNTARSNLGTSLGAAGGLNGQGTGFWQLLNQGKSGKNKNQLDATQYTQAQNYWNKTIANEWQGTGISKQQMQRIGGITDMRKRASALSNALSGASGNDAWNQIQNGTGNANQFTISLSGAAARLFNISGGPSGGKKSSNAGGSSITGTVNTPTGDMSNMGMISGLGGSYAGNITGNATLMP